MKILWNIWPLERSQGFSIFRPTDLVFDGTWPSFELDLDIIKMNILTNIHKDPMKNVTSRVVTSKSLRTHGRTDGRRTTDTARSQKLTLSLCDRWAKNTDHQESKTTSVYTCIATCRIVSSGCHDLYRDGWYWTPKHSDIMDLQCTTNYSKSSCC